MFTQIHATAQVSASASIGADSTIGENTIVGDDCQIGKQVRISSNVRLGKGVIIEDQVTLQGPAWIEDGVRLSQGVRAGEVQSNLDPGHPFTCILQGSQILPGASIAQGVWVGPKALVLSGARVLEDVQAGWVVGGDPAGLVYFMDGS